MNRVRELQAQVLILKEEIEDLQHSIHALQKDVAWLTTQLKRIPVKQVRKVKHGRTEGP